MTILLSLLTTIFVGGCTNKQIYQAIQESGRQECELLPYPRRSQCEEQYNKSYEQYERERQQREIDEILTDKR